MPYSLDHHHKADSDLLLWIKRFVKYKASTLSVSKIVNKDEFGAVLSALSGEISTKEEIAVLLKTLRRLAMPGVNSISYPILALYDYILLKKIKSIYEINQELILDFLASHTINLSDETKKNWRNSIKMFFGFIEENNEDAEGKVHLFRINLKNWGGLRGNSGDKPPAFLNESEIGRFLSALESYSLSKKPTAIRNACIIKTILYSGIRVGEAIGIKIKDIFYEGDLIGLRITGKGNKPGTAYILRSLIQKEMDQWSAIRDPASDYFFQAIAVKKSGKPLTQAYVSRVVEEICLSAGIRKHKNGAHMLRHTFASLLYLKTGDTMLLKESLRHSDIRTSVKYTHLHNDKLKKTSSIFE